MGESRSRAGLTRLALLGGLGIAVYLLAVRPWHLRWGATDEEVRRPLPGDDIVPQAQLLATRAISIHAPPAAVWPWLVQMGGYTRGGWYSYDRIDNGGARSASRIVPELQDLRVGDVMPTAPDGTGFVVERMAPERHLVMAIRRRTGTVTCAIVLDGVREGTRLIIRLRVHVRPTVRGLAFLVAMDVGDWVMMRRQLLGIRERVEQRALRPA